MTTTNQEVYDAFIASGAPEDKARAAAASVASQSDMATKKDLAELETRLGERMTRLILTAMGVQTGVLGVLIVILGIFVQLSGNPTP